MVERRFQFTPGNIYHIHNRGIDGRAVFEDDKDRDRFLMLLYVANGGEPVNVVRKLADAVDFTEALEYDRGEPLVDIGAYALMTDRFHLIIREREQKEGEEVNEAGIPQFMRKLTTAYAMYYNGRRKRRGPLFEGRYKAHPIELESELRYVRSRIHLAPIEALEPLWEDEGIQDLVRAESFLREYPYASYAEHIGQERMQAPILERSHFPDEFKESANFQDFIENWLMLQDTYDNKKSR